MIKTNLPVILLKGIVLLPNNEIRLEFENDDSKNIIDLSELFHDNYVLVVSQLDPLEENPDTHELPRIGVIAQISHKIELPNGKVRVIITGIARASVFEYLNLNKNSEILESIASQLEEDTIDEQQEIVLVRKLYRELEAYIKTVPYMSNSILSTIINMTSLSKVTDVIAPNLPISLERIQCYLIENSVIRRSEMILEDIYKEKEMFQIEKNIDLKVKKELDHNQKEYLLREKMKLMKKELGEVGAKEDEIDLLKQKIDKLEAPSNIKQRLIRELDRYENLSAVSPEVSIVRNYMDWLLELPWSNTTKDNEDLVDVRKQLDTSHYGLEQVKLRIIEYLAVNQMTNSLRGPILCFVGPPGVGKTSLVSHIAAAMNREFVKISVGGINDESEILGHRRAYLGASPGRIIQSLRKGKTKNPVFLIDEIDKMTKDFKGDPASALLEVLDPEQNQYFKDNYIEEEFDLSDVMFIATANYIEDIPEALKDRLEIVTLSGYTEFEKLDIAKRYFIPKLCKEHGIESEYLHFDDEVLFQIIREYTKEAGVRELERQLSTIIRKIVTSIVVHHVKINRLNITTQNLEKYLGKAKYHHHAFIGQKKIGVVTGLAYTSFGGDVLPIEVNYYPGKGDLVLTGSLGSVMKESAQIALSYIKSNADYFEIPYQKLIENDIHIHVPEGAIPKDGPSAGVTLTTALISAFTSKKVDASIAMTGEITLRGDVLAIGGLKEKSIGAHRNGIHHILIPHDNCNDIDEMPKEIKENMHYYPVKNYKEIYQFMFKKEKKL